MTKVIKVENLSKAYQLGDFGTGTISRDLERFWARMRGKEDPFLKIGEVNDRTAKGDSDMVWSLKDINFEINQGDSVGIIGRNGAGKSTLLKILSRVTSPTTGSIKVKGRIASLLEVGTGFHPELTGRENIYLNGAILGMRKAEIKRKFDAIVDFAGVERYIDTPVKRYSSGMYVRLAFAVAAHLESEILIVDEVLAVGDAEFQKKCLGKMDDISKGEGRTVLFVSHNMASIQSLCTQAMLLDNGHLIQPPDVTDAVINKYITQLNTHLKSTAIADRKDRTGAGDVLITDLTILDANRQQAINLISGKKTILSVSYVNGSDNYNNESLDISISISRLGGGLVTIISSNYLNTPVINNKKTGTVDFVIEKLPFMSGSYTANIMIKKRDIIQDWVIEAKLFEVENGDYYNTGINAPESHNSIYIDYGISIND
jgi:lipopolysaccharide transport system ATP-binding protein